MSAVASTEDRPASVALAVHEGSGASGRRLEASEQRRWMTWFGVPAGLAAVFVGAVFGTGQEWYLGLAIAAIIVDIGVLIWLAMSSDTNGLLGEHAHH